MKKLWTGICAAAVVLSIGTTGAFAAGMGRGAHHANSNSVTSNLTYRTQTTSTCAQFVDSNSDGICDTCGKGYGFVDANGDGICDNLGTHCQNGTCGNGYNFVDANGDGICDNLGTHCQNGTCGNGYVDTNGDGICDNQGSRPQNGTGLQRGFGGGRNR